MLNIEEIKSTLTYIINNNKVLKENGKKTTAVELKGESGIGKTSIIIQLAQSMGMDCVKLNLAQMEELGDLIGYPIKEYEIFKSDNGNKECVWIAKDLLDSYIKSGYSATGNSRMNYSKPMWIPKEENENGGILILDDYNRADPRFLTATMELIDRGQFLSWSLPKNWNIILTSNPDDGNYNVNSLDNAQETRYVSFNLDFDVDVWAKWAESEGIDSRCINFVLSYPEVFKNEAGVQRVNARSMVTFFNTISGFDDFSKTETLAMILNISEGCFTTKENVVGNLFTMFIANKLDKLISPEELVTGTWATVKKKLVACIYDNEKYRADIASVITTRFINYTSLMFDNKSLKTDVVVKRILELVEEEKILLTEDLLYNLIKTITVKYPARSKKLITNPKIIKKIIL